MAHENNGSADHSLQENPAGCLVFFFLLGLRKENQQRKGKSKEASLEFPARRVRGQSCTAWRESLSSEGFNGSAFFER